MVQGTEKESSEARSSRKF